MHASLTLKCALTYSILLHTWVLHLYNQFLFMQVPELKLQTTPFQLCLIITVGLWYYDVSDALYDIVLWFYTEHMCATGNTINLSDNPTYLQRACSVNIPVESAAAAEMFPVIDSVHLFVSLLLNIL